MAAPTQYQYTFENTGSIGIVKGWSLEARGNNNKGGVDGVLFYRHAGRYDRDVRYRLYGKT